MKKKLCYGILLGLFGVTLTACSSNSTEKVNTTRSKTKEIAFVENSQSEEKNIWYRYKSDSESPTPISKTSLITAMILTQNGIEKIYDLSEERIQLSDIAKISDKEIIALVEETDENRFDVIKENGIKELNETITQGQEIIDQSKLEDSWNVDERWITGLEEALPVLKNDLDKLQSMQYTTPIDRKIEAKIETDNVGKQTLLEVLDSPNVYFNTQSKKIEFDTKSIYEEREVGYWEVMALLELSYPIATTQILDSYYAGLVNSDLSSGLITRVADDSFSATLDTFDTPNVSDIDQ